MAAETGESTDATDGARVGAGADTSAPEFVRARCEAGGVARTGAGARRATGAGRDVAGAGSSATNAAGGVATAGVAMLFSVSVTALAAGTEYCGAVSVAASLSRFAR